MTSLELWECLNVSWHGVRRHAGLGPTGAHEAVPLHEGAGGALRGTGRHDDQPETSRWRFLVLGQQLERVDMTTRLLLSGIAASVDRNDWVTLLSFGLGLSGVPADERHRGTDGSD